MQQPTPAAIQRVFRRLCDAVGQAHIAATLGMDPSNISRRYHGERNLSLQEIGELVREYRWGRPAQRALAEELAHEVAMHMGGLEVLFEVPPPSTSVREASNVQQILSIFDQAAALLELVRHARPSGDLAAAELRVFVDRGTALEHRLQAITSLLRRELDAYDLHVVRHMSVDDRLRRHGSGDEMRRHESPPERP